METMFLIFKVVIGLLIVALLANRIMNRTEQPFQRDYHIWFWIGVVFLPLGILMRLTEENSGWWIFTIMGLVFLVLGWLHRSEWSAPRKFSDFSPKEKRYKLILFGILTLLLIAGFGMYWLLE